MITPAPTVTEADSAKRLLRVLQVGVTNRGIWPLEKCNADTGFRITALCDVSESGLAVAREKVGVPVEACHTNFEKALAESDVDCVILCVPTVLHVPWSIKALAAGRHVLMEKGMAPDWASAQRLAAATAASNPVACVAQNYRYFPVEQTIWRAIHDESHPAYVGPVHTLIYTQNRVRPVPRTLNYPFASVWDMSCHHFDNMMHWLGPVRKMTGHAWRAAWSAYEYPNNTAAHIEFVNGGHAHYLHTHDAARASLTIEVHGERGALVHRDDKLTFNERPLENFGTRPESDVTLIESYGESDLLRDFHAYITTGREPGVSVRNNLETMAACEMFVRSTTQDRPVLREELEAA